MKPRTLWVNYGDGKTMGLDGLSFWMRQYERLRHSPLRPLEHVFDITLLRRR